jgi:hypothetical protein
MTYREAPELATFQAAVGTEFTARLGDDAAVVFTLVEVKVYDRYPDWESFSLLFQRPGGAVAQGNYAIRHPMCGEFGLFLAPIQSVADEQQYEAVFNRPSA